MDDNGRAQLSTPIGTISVGGKRMAEIIAVLCLAVLIYVGTVVYSHAQESKQDKAELTVDGQIGVKGK